MASIDGLVEGARPDKKHHPNWLLLLWCRWHCPAPPPALSGNSPPCRAAAVPAPHRQIIMRNCCAVHVFCGQHVLLYIAQTRHKALLLLISTIIVCMGGARAMVLCLRWPTLCQSRFLTAAATPNESAQ